MTTCSLFLLLLATYFVHSEEAKYLYDTMQRQCGQAVELGQVSTGSLILQLTSNSRYTSLMDCRVTVKAAGQTSSRIHLEFLQMDINSFDRCPGDFLMVLDSVLVNEETFHFQDNSIKKYCGKRLPKPLTSTGNNLTLRFVSDSYASGTGFSLLLTAFHEDECESGEFRCDNNRCIDDRLRCDSYDNCGDNSDSCHLPVYVIAGVVVVSILAVVALLFLVVVLRYRCRYKRNDEDLSFENGGLSTP